MRDGVRPRPAGALPAQCAALNRAFLSVVELTVEAALTGDAELVRQAMLVDPNTAASLPVERIWELADAMLAAHAPRLAGAALRP